MVAKCLPKKELGVARSEFYTNRLGPLADKLLACSNKLASYLLTTSSPTLPILGASVGDTPLQAGGITISPDQQLSPEEMKSRTKDGGRLLEGIRRANSLKAGGNNNAYYSELNSLAQTITQYRILIPVGNDDCTTVALCYQTAYNDLPKACPEPAKPKAGKSVPKKEEPEDQCPKPNADKWGVRFRYKVGQFNKCLPAQATSQEKVALTDTIQKTKQERDLERSALNFLAGNTRTNPLPSAYEERDWFLSLLPAMRSVLPVQGGMDTPNAMPGMQFRVISNIAKHRIPGFQPIYQHLGVEATYITLIGTFTGDGGLGAITKYDDAYEGAKSKVRSTSEGGVASRAEDDFIDKEVGTDFLVKPTKKLSDRARKTEVPKNYLNGSLFNSDGCPGECGDMPSTNPGTGKSNLKQPYNVASHETAKPLWEIASQLDSYHEFVSFYKIAVQQGNELEVEVNVRRNNDGLKPRKGIESDPLRNIQTGNPKFKGYVRRMEVYHSRSDRTWYMIEMEVTDHALAGTKAINLTDNIDKQIQQALAAQATVVEANKPTKSEVLAKAGVRAIKDKSGKSILVLPPNTPVRTACLDSKGQEVSSGGLYGGGGCPTNSTSSGIATINGTLIPLDGSPYVIASEGFSSSNWRVTVDGELIDKSIESFEVPTESTPTIPTTKADSNTPSPSGSVKQSVSPGAKR